MSVRIVVMGGRGVCCEDTTSVNSGNLVCYLKYNIPGIFSLWVVLQSGYTLKKITLWH